MTAIPIKLSSDTETHPTSAMRQAMAEAPVGDEQKGTDPTVNALLERVADLLGKEAALFLPGGTMCNLVAIKVHTQPGDTVLADHMAHIIRAESAGAAVTSGVLVEPIDSKCGIFSEEALCKAIEKATTQDVPYRSPSRLLCIEQTHNFGGGAVWPLKQMQAIGERARQFGLSIHMDGARLLNAVASAGVPARDFANCIDSVWIDFTKGLGAPLGAVLAGSVSFIEAARLQKHIFGGALRQAGIVAAGCLHALDHHIQGLSVDHANARRLAAGLAKIPGIEVQNPIPDSNIVFFNPKGRGLGLDVFLKRLKSAGVEMGILAGNIRAVTHLDVSTADIDVALRVIAGIEAE